MVLKGNFDDEILVIVLKVCFEGYIVEKMKLEIW